MAFEQTGLHNTKFYNNSYLIKQTIQLVHKCILTEGKHTWRQLCLKFWHKASDHFDFNYREFQTNKRLYQQAYALCKPSETFVRAKNHDQPTI